MWLFISLNRRQLWEMDDAGHVLNVLNVCVGKPEHPTPVGCFYIADKIQNPKENYNDVDGNGLEFLGERVLETTISGFDRQNKVVRNYSIHGTNEPELIGTACSKGCIRITNEDIIKLYDKADIGMMVIIWFNDPISYLNEMSKYAYCFIEETQWKYKYTISRNRMLKEVEKLRGAK